MAPAHGPISPGASWISCAKPLSSGRAPRLKSQEPSTQLPPSDTLWSEPSLSLMRSLLSPALFLALIITGCKSQSGHSPAIGEAFAGPLTLELRQEINPRSTVIATVKHGERLEIVQQRRRFIR